MESAWKSAISRAGPATNLQILRNSKKICKNKHDHLIAILFIHNLKQKMGTLTNLDLCKNVALLSGILFRSAATVGEPEEEVPLVGGTRSYSNVTQNGL